MASVVTFGFSADVNARANRMRWPSGSSRYTLATVLQLPTMRAQTLEMSFDGALRHVDAVLVTVANTPSFGGGMQISPGASPVDGLADVTIVGEVARLRLLRLLEKVFDGSHVELPEVETLTARTVGVDQPGVEIWGDGERITTSPATIEVVPRAVRIAGASVAVPD